jgi:hypothetical protein
VRKKRVRVESDGVSVAEGWRSSGTGYKEYDAIAVSTTRTERRGFERERRTEKRRRREFDGAAEALVVRFEDAFSGITRSAASAACVASFRAFWRRR